MKNEIIGEKVILRPLREEDAEFFTYWYNTSEVMFQCGFHEPTLLENEIKRINRPEDSDEDWYAVTDKNTGKLVGETGLLRIWSHWYCTDMSIIIPNPEDQGKGYGSEATRLMLSRAFDHYSLNRVSIGVVARNTPALAFYKKIGFKQEGIQEQGYFFNGEFSDFVMMRILRSEYYFKEATMLPQSLIEKGFSLTNVSSSDLHDFIRIIRLCLKKYIDENHSVFGEWNEENISSYRF